MPRTSDFFTIFRVKKLLLIRFFQCDRFERFNQGVDDDRRHCLPSEKS